KVNIADRIYFRRVLQTHSFAAGEFQVGRLTGKPCINFGYPVLDEHGVLRRVLFASLKLEPLSEALAHIPLPVGAAITASDRKGTVLARYPAPEKWVGQSYSNSLVVKRILEQGSETFEMPGLDGEPRLHAVTPIRDGDAPGLFASVGIPLSTGYAQANADL